ncbi:MAG: hypothetical protein IT480_10710 [Gammaproteobacteria bacterium]|nr:hypothetical protein [Gammaproteobacteria bacterium]
MSYWSAAVVFVASFTVSEWAAMGGLLLALLTFLINVAFQYRKDQRDALIASAQMNSIAGIKKGAGNGDD